MATPITSKDGLTAFRERWHARRDELHRLHALVNGADLCDAFLSELDAVLHDIADQRLSLRQAAIESGYSRDHLGRLIRDGKLPNAGRRNAPKLRRGDLPRKASGLPAASDRNILRDPKRRVARACVNLDRGERNG